MRNGFETSVDETDNGQFDPSCTCGWTGETWEDEDDAQIEADNHWDDEHWELP